MHATLRVLCYVRHVAKATVICQYDLFILVSMGAAAFAPSCAQKLHLTSVFCQLPYGSGNTMRSSAE